MEGKGLRWAKAIGVLLVAGLALYGGWELWGQAQGWLGSLRAKALEKVSLR